MGFDEAREDGIVCRRGRFDIPCSVCGTEIIRSATYRRGFRYICEDCKSIEKGKSNEYYFIKKETKFRDAVSRIEVIVGDLKEYENAINKVYKTLHHTGWYKSTEEIMVAIELLKNGIKTIHQQKVDRYRVDFVLPEYKALLEVDRKPFHSDRRKEGIRDGNILLKMGLEWEMIRMDTDYINKDIRQLVPSIKAILADRRERYKRQVE